MTTPEALSWLEYAIRSPYRLSLTNDRDGYPVGQRKASNCCRELIQIIPDSDGCNSCRIGRGEDARHSGLPHDACGCMDFSRTVTCEKHPDKGLNTRYLFSSDRRLEILDGNEERHQDNLGLAFI